MQQRCDNSKNFEAFSLTLSLLFLSQNIYERNHVTYNAHALLRSTVLSTCHVYDRRRKQDLVFKTRRFSWASYIDLQCTYMYFMQFTLYMYLRVCFIGVCVIDQTHMQYHLIPKRIGRVEKCPSCFCNFIAFSSETASNSLIQYVALRHVISCSPYGTVSYRSCFVFFARITLKSPTTQCTVQCALNVVVTREECWKAIAEWVFNASFSDVGGIPSANILSTRCISLAMFQIPSWPLEAFSEHRTWGDKMQTFPLHFWRRSTFTGRISSRHRFTQPRNQCKSFRKK